MVVIVEEEGYFQITGFTEEVEGTGIVATLKDWAEGSVDGGTRTIKVRWDEDTEIIRDGLMKEDKELFCTVAKVLGKEVMGDFKLLPKDPPIMKMPELVMDMIFSSLSFEDLLNCRLASENWAFDLLPIQRIFGCQSLWLEGSYVGYTLELRGLAEPFTTYHLRCAGIKHNHLPAIAEASLFQNVKALYIYEPTEPTEERNSVDTVRLILENSRNTKDFIFEDKYPSLISTITWRGIETFVSNNHRHLGELSLVGRFPVDFVNFETFLQNCNVMHTLRMKLYHNSSLRNVGSLPSSITSLTLLKLDAPLSATQLSLIATTLTKLIKGNLHVKHFHSQDEEDEVNGSIISDIILTHPHPSLQALYLALGRCRGIIDFSTSICSKAGLMNQYLNDQLLTAGKGMGWNIDMDHSFSMEYWIMEKDICFQKNGDFLDDWN